MILSRELGKRIWGGSTNMDNGGGGVSSDAIAGLLTGYAKESWVDEHYISIDFFSRLFQAHGTENGSEIDVMPNDMDTTITSVESMFGFWTNLYISALGSNGAAPAGISLGMLTDVNISGTPSAGQVLTFDAVSGKWVNGNATGASSLSTLTDVTLTSLQNGQTLLYDSTTSKWYNSALKTINGQSLLGSGDISVGGGASGNYLPLTGGTLANDSTRMVLGISNSQGGLVSFNYGGVTQGTFGAQVAGGFMFLESYRSNGSYGCGLFIYPDYMKWYYNSTYYDVLTSYNGLPEPRFYPSSNYVFDNGMTFRVYNNSDESGIGLKRITGTRTSYFGGNESCTYIVDLSGTTGRVYKFNNNGQFQTRFLSVEYEDGSSEDAVIAYIVRNSASLYGFSIGVYNSGNAYLQSGFVDRHNNLSMSLNPKGGNVGVGNNSPSYTLHVSGTIYATGSITALSDARKKDITGEAGITVEQVAHAPAVQFLWKDKVRRKDGQQVGTLAQYWQTVLPEVVMDKGGELSMQYGVAALVSAIVTARKVVDHERRITELEKENERLKKEVEQLRLN